MIKLPEVERSTPEGMVMMQQVFWDKFKDEAERRHESKDCCKKVKHFPLVKGHPYMPTGKTNSSLSELEKVKLKK
jgi:hypothetical protein